VSFSSESKARRGAPPDVQHHRLSLCCDIIQTQTAQRQSLVRLRVLEKPLQKLPKLRRRHVLGHSQVASLTFRLDAQVILEPVGPGATQRGATSKIVQIDAVDETLDLLDLRRLELARVDGPAHA